MKNNHTKDVTPIRLVEGDETTVLSDAVTHEQQLSIFQAKITPAMAERLLQSNTHNRTVSERHVAKLQREIEGGRWKLNGDAIRISNGVLLDGQHRLEAVKRANLPIEALVIVGLGDDVFDTIDVGRNRTAGDTLSIRGEKHSARLAATIRFVNQYLIGKPATRGNYSTTEVEKILAENPEVRKSVDLCAVSDVKLPLPFAVLAGLHYLFAKKDPELADRVVEQIIKGTTATASPFEGQNDPIHLVREKHIQSMLKGQRIAPEVSAALLIKAWNHLRRKETAVKQITYRRGGDNPEKFPEIE